MMPLRKTAALTLLILLAAIASSCAGPRTKWFVQQPPEPLPAGARVDVYVGMIDPPYQPIAIIETRPQAYAADPARNEQIKQDQYEELCARARGVGANAIQNVQILAQHVKGMTPDERTPFKSWQQGRYNRYFMRGMAIKAPERQGQTLSDAEPVEGWAVSKLPVPPPLK